MILVLCAKYALALNYFSSRTCEGWRHAACRKWYDSHCFANLNQVKQQVINQVAGDTYAESCSKRCDHELFLQKLDLMQHEARV